MPPHPADHGHARKRGLRTTVPRMSQFAVEHLLLLPLGALIALVWVNTGAESYFRFSLSAAFIVNDLAMAIFFAVIMKEVVEATAPGGVLHPWRRALLPLIAAIGVVALPAIILPMAVEALGEPVLVVGWPMVFATDLAVTFFIARLIFGQHPIVPFLLLLGIVSNAMGFMSLALYPSAEEIHLGSGALLLVAGLAVAFVLRRMRMRSFWPYLVVAGGLCWFAFYHAGLHPALALVPIMPFLPHAARDPGFFVDASPRAKDTLSQFEVWWRYPAQMALFFFGLVNAGVPLRALEAGTWGLPVAVLIGKPMGMFIGVGAAMLAGLHLPRRVGVGELLVAGLLAAIGFTVALFFCSAIVPVGQARSELSMGAILSLAAAPIAIAVAWLFGLGRFARGVSA